MLARRMAWKHNSQIQKILLEAESHNFSLFVYRYKYKENKNGPRRQWENVISHSLLLSMQVHIMSTSEKSY